MTALERDEPETQKRADDLLAPVIQWQYRRVAKEAEAAAETEDAAEAGEPTLEPGGGEPQGEPA